MAIPDGAIRDQHPRSSVWWLCAEGLEVGVGFTDAGYWRGLRDRSGGGLGPFVVLLGKEGADEADDGVAVIDLNGVREVLIESFASRDS
jgi:hypothetical protein